MNKTLISFIVFMLVGVTVLFAYKLFSVKEKQSAERLEEKMNHPLRGVDILITGICYPNSQELSRFKSFQFDRTKAEVLDADKDNKNIVIVIKEEKFFKLNGVKYDIQGFKVECQQEKSPFNIVTVD